MGVLVNVGSIMGKDILNLADGTMIGKVCGVALTPDNKVAGLKVKEKKFMGNVNIVPFENVKAFGATITLNDIDGAACAEIRDAIGKNVITADGNLLGRVEELAFDSESGQVAEIVIKGELMETMVGGRGILPGEKIVSFGKDVVVAAENITAEDFHIPAEEFMAIGKRWTKCWKKLILPMMYPLMKTALNSRAKKNRWKVPLKGSPRPWRMLSIN